MKHKKQRRMFFGRILVLLAVLGCPISVQNNVSYAAKVKSGSKSGSEKKTAKPVVNSEKKTAKPVVNKEKLDEVDDGAGSDGVGDEADIDDRPAGVKSKLGSDEGEPDGEFDTGAYGDGDKKDKGYDADFGDEGDDFVGKGDEGFDDGVGEDGADVNLDDDGDFVDGQLGKIDKKRKALPKKNIATGKKLGAGESPSTDELMAGKPNKKSKAQAVSAPNRLGPVKDEASGSDSGGSSEKKASGFLAKALPTIDKTSLLNSAGDFYTKNGLAKSSEDPIYFNYVDIDSGEKGARGSNRQIACGFFSPTNFVEKFQVGEKEDFSTAVFELEDSSGNKYVCNNSKYIDGPFPVGDFVAFKVFIGFDDLVDQKIKIATGFRLKPGKEYVFRVWKGPFVEAGVDMKTGAVKEASKGELMAEVCGVVPVKNSADGLVEPFGVDGGIAGTGHFEVLKKFAHPKAFNRGFFSRKYKKIMKKRMERMRYL